MFDKYMNELDNVDELHYQKLKQEEEEEIYVGKDVDETTY